MTNKDFFIQTWKGEMPRTLSAIKGLPDDMSKLNYQSDPKSRSAAGLISHILGHAEVMCNAVDSFIADEQSAVKQFSNKEEAASYFEKNATAMIDKISKMDDKTWTDQIVDFRVNGRSIYAFPMTNTFWMLLFDMVHHRGQLSTYYRPMGVRNPAIYGPTAEDMEAMAAAAQN